MLKHNLRISAMNKKACTYIGVFLVLVSYCIIGCVFMLRSDTHPWWCMPEHRFMEGFLAFCAGTAGVICGVIGRKATLGKVAIGLGIIVVAFLIILLILILMLPGIFWTGV